MLSNSGVFLLVDRKDMIFRYYPRKKTWAVQFLKNYVGIIIIECRIKLVHLKTGADFC